MSVLKVRWRVAGTLGALLLASAVSSSEGRAEENSVEVTVTSVFRQGWHAPRGPFRVKLLPEEPMGW